MFMSYTIYVEVLDNYIKELDTELKIDVFNIKDVQLKLPSTKHKWVARLIRHKQQIRVLEKQRAEYKSLVIATAAKSSPVRLTEMVSSRLADSNEAIKEFDQKIKDQELIVEFLEKTEKILSATSFDLRNITEIMKLEQT